MTTSTIKRRASGQALIVLLGLLSTLGPFSNDTLLPNFPPIQSTFAVGGVQMQQALTAYFIPFAFMMLLHGALSDAYGRRRVIMIGMSAYALAALVCALAQTFEMFLVGRTLQGLSAGAGIVVSRAIVRDVYADQDAQRALALVMIIFGVAPGIAPILGGWIGHLYGWRAVFYFLTVLASTLVLVTLTWLPETLPPARRIRLSPGTLAAGYVQAFGSARFVLLLCAHGLSFGGFFIYIVSAAAFGYDVLGIEQTEFVWIFGPAIGGMILGSFVSGRLAGRMGPATTVFVGYVFMGAAAVFNTAYHASHAATLPVSVLPIFVYTLGLGIAMPSIMLMVLDLMPQRRGLASSLVGFAQSGFSAVLAGLVAHLVYASAYTLARCSLVLVSVGFFCWLCFLARIAYRMRRARA